MRNEPEHFLYARDLDGTGSLHICGKGDRGAIAFIAKGAVLDLIRSKKRQVTPTDRYYVSETDLLTGLDENLPGGSMSDQGSLDAGQVSTLRLITAEAARKAERAMIRDRFLNGFAGLIQLHPKWRGHATLAKTVRDLINRVCEELTMTEPATLYQEWLSTQAEGSLIGHDSASLFLGFKSGASAQRANIRKAILDKIQELTHYVTWTVTRAVTVDEPFVVAAELIAALDEICPDDTEE